MEATSSLYSYKESDKKEDYHKRQVTDTIAICINETSVLKERMATCYEYFTGSQVNGFNQLFDAFNVTDTSLNNNYAPSRLDLPLIHMNINKIKPKIQTLVGELIDLGFEASVEAINEEAKSAKQQYRTEMLALVKSKDKINELDKLIGIDMGMSQLPNTVEELESFLKYDYKENSEVVLEACLKYSLAFNGYLYQRMQMFLDAAIAGECHAITKVVKGMPIIERSNPLANYYPTNVNDNDYLDKTYRHLVIQYMKRSEVLDKYQISEQEAKEDLEKYQGNSGSVYGGVLLSARGGAKMFTPYMPQNRDMILVATAYWMDEKPEKTIVIKGKDGIENSIVLYGEDTEEKAKKRIRREEKKGNTVEVREQMVSTFRQATLIGCDLLKDWGEVDCQPLAPLSWADCEKPITSFRPYYLQGQSKSTVMDVMQIQDFIEYIWTKVQLEITKSSGKSLYINLKAIPRSFGASPQESIPKVLHYLKGYNLIFGDYEQEEGKALPVEEVDMGLSETINSYFNILQILEMNIDQITGLNQTAMGQMKNNQLASVTEMMLNQSNKQTKYLVSGFLDFESRLLSKHIQQIKYSWWAYPEIWRAAIGDVYLAFLEATRDISLDIHMVKVRNNIISKTTLQQYLMASLQTGSISPADALRIEMTASESTKEAIRQYIALSDKKEAMAMQQQQQMAEAQAAQADAINAQREQTKMATAQSTNEAGIAKQRMKGEYELQNTALKNEFNQANQFN